MPDTYSWNLLGSASSVNAEDAPPAGLELSRYALSFLLVPVTFDPHASLTVVNPHPESWNTYMFPYGGVRIEDETTALPATFKEISNRLHALIGSRRRDYFESASRELSETFDSIPDLDNLVPVYRNYSLKFSASAEMWTAYMFTYYPVARALLGSTDLATKSFAIADADDLSAMSSEPLEENVLAFASTGLARFWATAY